MPRCIDMLKDDLSTVIQGILFHIRGVFNWTLLNINKLLQIIKFLRL